VGRITAILNNNYNNYHKCKVGFFGFFDCINDYDVAQSLFDMAAKWCRDKGLSAMLGPTNFSTNDTAGILIEGFHEPPKIMMTYNAPYYKDLAEKYGMVKDMDLFAYILYTNKASEKSIKLAQTLEERLNRQGITFRNINLKDFYNEVAKIREIYNEAWQDNWGFVPWTDGELKHLADDLKMLVNENWCYMAEHDGKPIGFGVTLNDVNEITKGFKKGRLLPFNIIKLLLNRHKTKFVRILALGVKSDYRKKGIEAIFFAKNILAARKFNVTAGEVSWVLEDNEEMNASAIKLNSELYKKYRIYRFDLNPA
jgi:GNAT superfamily N-acetyltransferase